MHGHSTLRYRGSWFFLDNNLTLWLNNMCKLSTTLLTLNVPDYIVT